MGTIAEKLSHLLETKSLIKDAIEQKGVGVSEHNSFRDYAKLIASIIRSGLRPIDISIASDLKSYTIIFEDNTEIHGVVDYDSSGLPTYLYDDSRNSADFIDGWPSVITRNDTCDVRISEVTSGD